LYSIECRIDIFLSFRYNILIDSAADKGHEGGRSGADIRRETGGRERDF
jgi:hypothetical protein